MNFSERHPATQFIFFSASICSVILNRNPFFLCISLVIALVYRIFQLRSIRILKEIFFYILLTGFLTMLIPLVSHNGKTALFFINDNAVTKEAIFLGFSIGLEFSAVICWFSCMSHVMSGEKIIYLISGIAPRLAVFISGIMKFVPLCRKQYLNIYRTQKNIYSGYKRLRKKIYIIIRSFSALITWIIESSADSADSMYARGYGLSGRSSFSIYRFRRFDVIILAAIVYLLPFTVASVIYRTAGIVFYPETVIPLSAANILISILWTIIMLIPVVTEICEEYKWKLLRSKI